MARLIDGTFNIRNGIIQVITAPGWTRAAIKQVQQALASAQHELQQPGADQQAVLGKTARRLDHAKPGLGTAVMDWCAQPGNQGLMTLIGLLAAVLFGFHGLMSQGENSSDSLDKELVERLVEDAYRDGNQDAHLGELESRLKVLEDSTGRDEGIAKEPNERDASNP